MAYLLLQELSTVGLHLNASKTQILHTDYKDDGHDLDFVEIDNEFVKILSPDE